MKNYKYIISRKEYVLNEDEHKQVLEAMNNKKSHAMLRNGSLIIKLDLIGIVTETDETSEPNYEAPALNPAPFRTTEQERASKERGLKKLGDWVKQQDWYKNKDFKVK